MDANKTGIPSCTAPSDKDNVIRKEADGPPPAPEGSTAVVVPPKIETLEEKKIRKQKYNKRESSEQIVVCNYQLCHYILDCNYR